MGNLLNLPAFPKLIRRVTKSLRLAPAVKVVEVGSDIESMTFGRPPSKPRPGKLIFPAVGAVILSAMTGATLLRSADPRTVSQVRQEIRDIVLTRSDDPDVDDGGELGPWHVAASSIDDRTGELRDFRLRSGAINLGAARARLEVDPHHDTFSFLLRDVVIIRVPDKSDGERPDHVLIPLDSFRLGPAKYHRPIVQE